MFVVDAVTSFEETVKEWLLPALGLTVEVPVAWERRSTAGKVHFHLPDTETPLITLYTQSRPTREEDLPKGVSIVIDGVPAVRQTNEESGGQTLYILQPEKLLVLDYAPPPAEAAENVRLDWLHMLSSITFERRITPKPTQPSSAVAGTACGGPAGILCPSGQYCEVTDVHSDIGVCKGL